MSKADQAMQWLSRTIAIVGLMVLPGYGGNLADQQLGTKFLAPLGFGLGISAGTVLLIVLAKKLVPPARGEPIPFEDEIERDQEES